MSFSIDYCKNNIVHELQLHKLQLQTLRINITFNKTNIRISNRIIKIIVTPMVKMSCRKYELYKIKSCHHD